MLVLFEGTDCAGKTTAAKLLAEKLNGEYIHYSKPDKDPFEYFLPAVEKARTGIVVCDRHLLGEKIYSKVKGTKSEWKDGDYERMLSLLEEIPTFLIHVWEYKELLNKRHTELGETFITQKQQITVQNLFKKECKRIAKQYPKITVLSYKPTSNLIRYAATKSGSTRQR